MQHKLLGTEYFDEVLSKMYKVMAFVKFCDRDTIYGLDSLNGKI